MPLFGPPNIEKLKANGRIADLIKALSYKKNSQVRRNAAIALGQITETDDSIIDESIYLTNVEQALMEALYDEDVQVQKAAILALKGISGPRFLKSLLQDLLVGEAGKSETAVMLLKEFKDPRIVMALIQILQKGASTVRENARKVLSVYEDPHIAEFLIPLLDDKNPIVRGIAIKKLGFLGNPIAVTPLANALKKAWKESENRANTQQKRKQYKQEGKQIIYSLKNINHPHAVSMLVYVLKSSQSYENDVRMILFDALGKIGGKSAAEALSGFLPKGIYSEKLAVIEALEGIGHQSAVPSLIKALEDPKTTIRRSAAQALRTIYQSGEMSKQNKKMILDARSSIVAQHTDQKKGTHVDTDKTHFDKNCFEDLHFDRWEKGPYPDFHSDYEKNQTHTDEGIGIEFPL